MIPKTPCESCGGDNPDYEFCVLCPPCFKKACEPVHKHLGLSRQPKPKFWLWDFRKRDLSYASFGYGLFFGIGLCLGVHAVLTGNLATYSLSVIFFANGKYLHSNLPLSK